MSEKIFLFNFAKCNGCHNCQIACKDEHCGQAWLPVAQAQPLTGHFWCKITEEVHGIVPKVNVTYQFNACGHCADCAVMAAAPEACYRREDGLVIIDPEKAAGMQNLVDACPYGQVYWNAELALPQKCTGCAHLLDDGWTEPRCVDACGTGGLRFGTKEEFSAELENATQTIPGSNIYYLNFPKRWLAGEVYDEEADEVIIGAKITIQGEDGTVLVTESDDFGDFWFRQIDAQPYTVWFEAEGYLPRTLKADATNKDAHMGSIALYQA